MVGEVIECLEIVHETACDHVQVNPPSINEPEARHHLRDGVGMHVQRLYGNERAKALGVLDHDLSHEPGVDQRVIRIDQHPATPRTLAPLGYFNDSPDIVGAVIGLHVP